MAVVVPSSPAETLLRASLLPVTARRLVFSRGAVGVAQVEVVEGQDNGELRKVKSINPP